MEKLRFFGALLLVVSLAAAQTTQKAPTAKKPAAKKAAATPVPPPPPPKPEPTPPSGACMHCETMIEAMQKGVLWHTFAKFPDEEAKPAESGEAGKGKLRALIVVAGSDMTGGPLTIQLVGTGVSAPGREAMQGMMGMGNAGLLFASGIQKSKEDWKLWMEHAAYAMEQGKLKAYIAFFEEAEVRDGMKASLQQELTPASMRRLAQAGPYPPD